MNIQVIICSNNGTPTGEYVGKEIAHTGEGKQHLAITVLIENSKDEVLLQHRKHKRFDGLWDLTGATDLHHTQQKDESFEDATLRCLRKEFGIEGLKSLQNLGGFNYFMKDGDFCENEFCVLFLGKYDGTINLNPEVGYGYEWVKKDVFLKYIKKFPQEYTPWAVESSQLLT